MLYRDLYKKFISKKISLTDQLAVSRSLLANERTFLSYQRSALNFAIAGLTLIKFFDWIWIVIIGWSFLPLSLVLIFIGVLRYRRMHALILNLEVQDSEKQKAL